LGHNKKLTDKRLSELWANNEVKALETSGEKYVIVSDLHMGDGGRADDFRNNKDTMKRALEYYKENNFKLILLGDIEELWQFDMTQIENKYEEDIYEKIRAFDKDNVFRVFGNHDFDWNLKDPIRKDSANNWAVEALKMKDKNGKETILLVHGHQGSTESDKNSWISRIFVRRVWKPIEPLVVKIGLYGHPSATKSQVAKNYEKILYSWAKKKKIILICGHSHRAIYASKSYIDKLKSKIRRLQSEILSNRDSRELVKKNIKKIEKLNQELAEEKLKGREINSAEGNKTPLPCYFNSGCALYTDGITTLEIADDAIKLVKWHRKQKDGKFFEIYDDGDGQTMSDYIRTIKS
jgi:UDP-2,3-diacylglucosamine pyrophosphatase LpxH